MATIAFIDIEVGLKSGKVLDYGSIKDNGSRFHSNSLTDFIAFLKGTEFVCGHNVLNHDLKYIKHAIADAGINSSNSIDTLFLSPLLFPSKPYHALLKDDKLQTEDVNNPLNDSIKAKDLLYDEVAAFTKADDTLKQILFLLLSDKREFDAFFRFIGYKNNGTNLAKIIGKKFESAICRHADIDKIIAEHPIDLAYCLALINCQDRYSITPRWVLKNYSATERLMFLLRNNPCLSGCDYCDHALDIHQGLKTYFGFDSYRTYAGQQLQENAVKAAVDNKSILAVFPTGGGKSITFQVPALMGGENLKGLTVVISPLQSLMKDQVDNLEAVGITDAVTINGLLDPINKAKSLERVEQGLASILYISPESLRSKTIERLLLGRKIVRFVIDEAHCFSTWGQDFRVDYLYIGDFIKSLQEQKNLGEGIPVSCFTATAKPQVIEDIQSYFKEKLSIELMLYISKERRTNLRYQVIKKETEEEKYNSVRDLMEEQQCPTIIYVSKTRQAEKLARKLTEDGFDAKPYHGKMDVREKTANQNAFIAGDVSIMVATSAFGMGVDKKDVGMVIHYEISNSLENYIQEAGRAGRDEKITANCYVLFNEDDLSGHFTLLNQTKLNIKEIQQIWKAIKDLTQFRSSVSKSALEIARKAGWDETVREIDTRVTTAISALEEAGYLERKHNVPHIYANSILTKNAQQAIDKINASQKFVGKQKQQGIRIIKQLLSSKSRQQANDETAESRIDYIADCLAIKTPEVINIVNLLREENILADTKDLTAFIKIGELKNRSLNILKAFSKIENFLLTVVEQEEKKYNIKELNEQAEKEGCSEISLNKLKTIINFWAIKRWIKQSNHGYSKNHLVILANQPPEILKEKLEKRHALAEFIVDFLYHRSNDNPITTETEEVLVEFSVHELKEEYQKQLLATQSSIDDIEEALFYLTKIEAVKIEGGFLVIYNKLTINRIEQDNKKRYKNEDYQKLKQFYQNKVQQIHIVGEYANKMIGSYKQALQFVDDYFQLNYSFFLGKYFKGNRHGEVSRNITPAKFRQLFGDLSVTQLSLINDKETKYIVVAAGPGSGKTRVLVHKLASLLLMEDVKHEQLLMLTFSRAAATEFKKRLFALIGNAAYWIEIKTFHSYCFDLLGKIGNLEGSEQILQTTIEKIKNKEVETSQITKTVLVIDEAQDMSADEFALVNALMEHNEDMRVIAVGDDDQNIYEFRGSSAKYLTQFITEKKATKHELIENYRSKNNLVEFTNAFVSTITVRLKKIPIVATQNDNGKIKIVHYQSQHIIVPLVAEILSTELAGTICVLTKTNDEALQVTGLLLENKMPAKLIQSNEGFSLYNLCEVRFLLEKLALPEGVFIIDDELWSDAKRELNDAFRNSTTLEICTNLIKDFELTNPKKKYRSDLEVFIRESKIEDFFNEAGETILVSTIHQAKGKEFDHVFLLLKNFNPVDNESKRQLYVAMTRAKQHLEIHLNGNYLDDFSANDLVRVNDNNTYLEPNRITAHLSLGDVYLDYTDDKQDLIGQLMSGDSLIPCNEGCRNSKRQPILRFSKKYKDTTITEMKKKGYELKDAEVNFIVYWKGEERKQEIQIILPKVYFEKAIS